MDEKRIFKDDKDYQLLEEQTEEGTVQYIHKPRGSVAELLPGERLKREVYEAELNTLQIELVKLQEWIKQQGLRVVVLFEGRDAAGKGGVIKRITAKLNPRVCRVVALPAPSNREAGQWFFQRYISHLPTRGEMVLFDRSWYNRAGVERVMGFCSEEEYEYFMKNVNILEKLLIDDGVILIKYWFSVSDLEQERRFQKRINDPLKRWKLSPMDLQSRARWEDYTKAKDAMMQRTNTGFAPWYIVKADDKRRARLNCISHLLSMIDYNDLTGLDIELPERQVHSGYKRQPIPVDNIVPDRY